jgi:hypothetical protein
MSNNELSLLNASNLPSVNNEALEALDDVAKASDFLPRIQLVTKGKYVDTGKIPPGRWGVPQTGGEDIEDLGDSIDVIPLAVRPKALDISDREAIVTSYDNKSEEFLRIKQAPKNSGCMWGPSFLVLERSTGRLHELFFGNKSGRNEAGKLKPFLPSNGNGPQPATLGIRYKQTSDYGWHVPVVKKCSEPFDEDAVKVSNEELRTEIDKFLNPKEEEVEVVEEEKKTRRAR